jgi:hypothetical protein
MLLSPNSKLKPLLNLFLRQRKKGRQSALQNLRARNRLM